MATLAEYLRRARDVVRQLEDIIREIEQRPQDPLKPAETTAAFYVQDAQGMGLSGALVQFRLDDQAEWTSTTSAHDGRVEYTTHGIGRGVNVKIDKDGYLKYEGRRVVPGGAIDDWPAVTMLTAIAPPVSLPPIPSREQVCEVRTHLQGLVYHSPQYGAWPANFFWHLLPDRKEIVYPAHKAVKDTHISISISGSYKQPGTAYPPHILEGSDWTKDLPAFKALLFEIITNGLFPDIALAGDGQSVGNATTYNDPVGSTYGRQWLMNNLPRILKAIRGDSDSECPDGMDLTPYCIFRPGWDGVF